MSKILPPAIFERAFPDYITLATFQNPKSQRVYSLHVLIDRKKRSEGKLGFLGYAIETSDATRDEVSNALLTPEEKRYEYHDPKSAMVDVYVRYEELSKHDVKLPAS